MNKKVKNILRYITSIFFAFCLISIILVNVAKSTILDKNYILNKIEKTGYYVKVYSYIKENFKNHIQQSGLDESILENLISQEKVENDTKLIITNVYNNVNEKISTDDIKEKLTNSIEEQTRGMLITTNQKEEINKFIDDICNEYKVGIASFEIEKEFYLVINKIEKIVDILNKISLIGLAVSIIILIYTSIHRPYKFFVFSGISLLASGAFLTFINIYINTKVNVGAITILNDAFSFTFREVLENILNEINSKGIVFFVLGFILILIPTFIHTYIKNKRYLNKQ